MLLRVVRVNGVRHVRTQEETAVDGLEVLLLVEGGQGAEDPLRNFHGHIAIGTLG